MDTEDAVNQRERENPANWAAGIIYRSNRDSRWMVPKRPLGWGGIRQTGWTLNFAHRRSWWVLLGLCSVPLGFALLGILHAVDISHK